MRVALILSIALGLGAGCRSNGKEVCQKAGEKLAACFQQTFGNDEMVRTAKVNATSAEAIDACAADERSVKAYEDCNSIEDCGKFFECTGSHAE